jgi:PEP-CTERM motif
MSRSSCHASAIYCLSVRTRFGPFAIVAVMASLFPAVASAQVPTWSGYAENSQHTGLSTVAADNLTKINWETPVDYDLSSSQYGSDLYIHYGSPMISAANTVIVPVKTTATNFQISAFNGATGVTKWTQTTDYILPPLPPLPYGWTPSYSPTLSGNNGLFYAGAGGTIYYRTNVNNNSAATPSQLAFYGIANYTSHQSMFNSSVYIDTPITSSTSGNIDNLYFGYEVTGSTPVAGLQSGQGGIAHIAYNTATNTYTSNYASAAAATGDTSMNKVVMNCAPALSNDGSTVYVAVNSGTFSQSSGYLVALNSSTLTTKSKVVPQDPQFGGPATMPDEGTASPTIGPDGEVYFGVLDNLGSSRGWLEHYSANLSTTKTPGGFGWDDTVTIVPKSMVPSYHGNSAYLLMTKYNNYVETGGGGQNMIAILDPNASMIDNSRSRNNPTGATIMQTVLTTLGPTPNSNGGVYEWCDNNAVVDPATDSILVTSEDGSLYRWNLSTGQLSQNISLNGAIGEAYTPTMVGPDGTVYAINNGILFAIVPEPSTLVLGAIGVIALAILGWRRRSWKRHVGSA